MSHRHAVPEKTQEEKARQEEGEGGRGRKGPAIVRVRAALTGEVICSLPCPVSALTMRNSIQELTHARGMQISLFTGSYLIKDGWIEYNDTDVLAVVQMPDARRQEACPPPHRGPWKSRARALGIEVPPPPNHGPWRARAQALGIERRQEFGFTKEEAEQKWAKTL